jgi:hypothetical protein
MLDLDCLTLKMEGLRSFKSSGITHPVTQHQIPQDRNLQQHCCDSLKPMESYVNLFTAAVRCTLSEWLSCAGQQTDSYLVVLYWDFICCALVCFCWHLRTALTMLVNIPATVFYRNTNYIDHLFSSTFCVTEQFVLCENILEQLKKLICQFTDRNSQSKYSSSIKHELLKKIRSTVLNFAVKS